MCEISYLLKNLDGVVAELLTVKNKLPMKFIFLFAEFSGPLFRLRGPVCQFWLGHLSSFRISCPQALAHLGAQGGLTVYSQPLLKHNSAAGLPVPEEGVQGGWGGLLCHVHVVKNWAIFVCSHRGFLLEGLSPSWLSALFSGTWTLIGFSAFTAPLKIKLKYLIQH